MARAHLPRGVGAVLSTLAMRRGHDGTALNTASNTAAMALDEWGSCFIVAVLGVFLVAAASTHTWPSSRPIIVAISPSRTIIVAISPSLIIAAISPSRPIIVAISPSRISGNISHAHLAIEGEDERARVLGCELAVEAHRREVTVRVAR